MAQFGGNKNSPWSRGGPQGGPGGPMDMQAGLVAAAMGAGPPGFAAQGGHPQAVFQQGMPPHPSQLGMGGHPPVTLSGIPGQQVHQKWVERIRACALRPPPVKYDVPPTWPIPPNPRPGFSSYVSVHFRM